MKITIHHRSLVLNFLDEQFNSDSVSQSILTYIDANYKIDSKIPDGWNLQFYATYTNARSLLVSKNRFGTYPSEKTKEITIPIPIPLKENVEWGVDKDQHIYGIDHYDKLMKNFWELDLDFRIFNNRTEFIVDSMKRGVEKSFLEGVTVGGVKITL